MQTRYAQNLMPGVGAWHPHVMVFAPYYDNAMLGGNEFGCPPSTILDPVTLGTTAMSLHRRSS